MRRTILRARMPGDRSRRRRKRARSGLPRGLRVAKRGGGRRAARRVPRVQRLRCPEGYKRRGVGYDKLLRLRLEGSHVRMEDMGGVVHALLEGAVEVGEGLRATGEAHALAEVVSTLCAVVAVVAHDAGLNGDTLAGDEVLHAWTDGGDDTGGFMAEDEGSLYGEVTVSAVEIVVD